MKYILVDETTIHISEHATFGAALRAGIEYDDDAYILIETPEPVIVANLTWQPDIGRKWQIDRPEFID